jgi:hypothetical protein
MTQAIQSAMEMIMCSTSAILLYWSSSIVRQRVRQLFVAGAATSMKTTHTKKKMATPQHVAQS